MEHTLVNENYIFLNEQFEHKEDILEFIVSILENINRMKLFEKILEREKIGSTYIGNFVALPHLMTNLIEGSKVIIIKNDNFIEWEHKKKIKVIIFIILNEKKIDINMMKNIEHIMSKLAQEEILKKLNKCINKKEIIDILLY